MYFQAKYKIERVASPTQTEDSSESEYSEEESEFSEDDEEVNSKPTNKSNAVLVNVNEVARNKAKTEYIQ